MKITIECNLNEFMELNNKFPNILESKDITAKRNYTSPAVTQRRKKIKYDKLLNCINSNGRIMTTNEIFTKNPLPGNSYRTYQRYLHEMFMNDLIEKRNITDENGNRNYWRIK